MNFNYKSSRIASEIFARLVREGLDKDDAVEHIFSLVKKRMRLGEKTCCVSGAQWLSQEAIENVLFFFYYSYDAITEEGVVLEHCLNGHGVVGAMTDVFSGNLSHHIRGDDSFFQSKKINRTLAVRVANELGVECFDDIGNIAIMVYLNDEHMLALSNTSVEKIFTIFDLRKEDIETDINVIPGIGIHDIRIFLKNQNESNAS